MNLGERIAKGKVDLTARAGLRLSNKDFAQGQYDKAAEYFTYDWEFGQSPDVSCLPFLIHQYIVLSVSWQQSSWIATSLNYNGTFDPIIGFGDSDLMCIDPQGMWRHHLSGMI